MKPIRKIARYSLLAVMLAGVGFLYLQHRSDAARIAELVKDNQRLTDEEKQTIVVQRVSQQMEEIAREQQKVSEKEREEAIKQAELAKEQTVLANQMRAKAQSEEHLANEARIQAEQNAIEAGRNADEAKRQKQVAEDRQAEAERLSRISLAHAMANQAVNLYNSDNLVLANLLSYGAWVFSQRNGDSKYQRAIYAALKLTGSQMLSVQPHKAGLNAIGMISRNELVTVGRYGELVRWSDIEGRMRPQTLYADNRYDFRDVYIDKDGHIYALTRKKEVMKDGVWMSDTKNILPMFPSVKQEKQIEQLQRSLPRSIAPDQISALAQSPDGLWAFGMKDGSIYLTDSKFNIKNQLFAHKSQISKVLFRDNFLYTSSYDCTVQLWNLSSEVLEPLTICQLEGGRWINDFLIMGSYMWISDGIGSLTRIVLEPTLLARKTHDNLKRDFTQEEWNAYVGKDIPYEKLK